MAKRKPTSRPRADRGPQPQRRTVRGVRDPGRAPAPAERRGPVARAWATVSRFAFAIVLVAAVAGGIAIGVHQGRGARTGASDPTAVPADTTPPPPFASEQDAARGRPTKEVFAHTCGTCHTLRAAGVRGIIGPDLDRAVLSAGEVRGIIRTGSLDTVMPRNLLVGRDADRVARYVARVSRASRRARSRR